MLYFSHCRKYHKVISILQKLSVFLPQNSYYLTLQVLLAQRTFHFPHCVLISLLNLLCKLWNTNYFTFRFVENNKPFFPHSEKCTLKFPQCRKLKLHLHIVEFINVSFKLSTLLIIWNIPSIFLPLSQQIYGDFHKSFRNLSNFFHEHARGARAIFYL